MFHNDKSIEKRLQFFHDRLCADTYDILGVTLFEDRAIFRVWAPNAYRVSVVGDFNGWNSDANPMRKVTSGIWEAEVEKVNNYDSYKYAITSFSGNTVLKADPYARHCETAPGTASKIYFDEGYAWKDSAWRKKMEKTDG